MKMSYLKTSSPDDWPVWRIYATIGCEAPIERYRRTQYATKFRASWPRTILPWKQGVQGASLIVCYLFYCALDFWVYIVHNCARWSMCIDYGVEMPGNGFLHSHSLPFPCNRFPFLPIPIPNFVTNSNSHGIPIRLFPFIPIPIPEHYIDAA